MIRTDESLVINDNLDPVDPAERRAEQIAPQARLADLVGQLLAQPLLEPVSPLKVV